MRRQLAFFLILLVSLLGVAAIAQQGPSPIGPIPGGGGVGTVTGVTGTSPIASSGGATPAISIAASALTPGCTSNCTYVLTTADQQWAQTSAGAAVATNNVPQFIRFYNNATRGLGNACFRITTASAGGHVSIGVYNTSGTQLWTTGSQLTTSATSLCVTPTPVTLAAGTNYCIGWCADNTTAILATVANTSLWQFTNNTGAPAHTFGLNSTDTCTSGVLPSTITPGNIANTNLVTLPYLQVFL
jgi:hypothetical protein